MPNEQELDQMAIRACILIGLDPHDELADGRIRYKACAKEIKSQFAINQVMKEFLDAT
jgi:hypothetical protein